jgi:hypothetical protein
MKNFGQIPLLTLFLIIFSSSCILQKEKTIDLYAIIPSPTTLLDNPLSESTQHPINQPTLTIIDPMFAGSDEFGDGFIARIPIAEVDDKSPEEIMDILINRSLEHYLNNEMESYYRLSDYFVYKIEIKDYYRPPYEIFAEVQYFIKPSQRPNGWLAGSVSYNRGWEGVNKVFGIFKDGDYFRLRMLVGWGT